MHSLHTREATVVTFLAKGSNYNYAQFTYKGGNCSDIFGKGSNYNYAQFTYKGGNCSDIFGKGK